MSVPGFKARVDLELTCFLTYMQCIPQIHLWCVTPSELSVSSKVAELSDPQYIKAYDIVCLRNHHHGGGFVSELNPAKGH